jgi:hypothetical protein
MEAILPSTAISHWCRPDLIGSDHRVANSTSAESIQRRNTVRPQYQHFTIVGHLSLSIPAYNSLGILRFSLGMD